MTTRIVIEWEDRKPNHLPDGEVHYLRAIANGTPEPDIELRFNDALGGVSWRPIGQEWSGEALNSLILHLWRAQA